MQRFCNLYIKHMQHNVAKSTFISFNNMHSLYILVEKEYEGLSEVLHLQSKCFLDLLILREDLSPSQLSVILTEFNIICIIFYYFFYSLKCYIIINGRLHQLWIILSGLFLRLGAVLYLVVVYKHVYNLSDQYCLVYQCLKWVL